MLPNHAPEPCCHTMLPNHAHSHARSHAHSPSAYPFNPPAAATAAAAPPAVHTLELTCLRACAYTQFGPIIDVVALKTFKMRGQAFVVFRDISAATEVCMHERGTSREGWGGWGGGGGGVEK